MKKPSFILTGIFMILILSCGKTKEESLISKNETAIATSDNSVERGKYLVTVMDCNACHTPNILTDQGPKPDMSRMLSGYPDNRPVPAFDGGSVSKGVLFPHPDLTAAMGPWGISFAGNLTPDPSGIGSWSLEQFSKAIREGKFKGLDGSRSLMPPMPWISYKSLSDADVEAIFNYLKTIPAIDNVVPAHVAPAAK